MTITHRRLFAPALPAGIALALAATAPSAAARAQPSALATAEQLAAERTLLALLADPEIKADQAKLVAELRASATGQLPDGRARAENAVAQWTNSLILRELSADPVHPAILWEVDNTPHNWFGHSIDGMAVAGDNPDHIYRGTFIDGSARYVIDGWVDPKRRPAQFSFEVTRDGPAKLALKAQNASHPDMGGQIGMLTDRDIQVDPDGHFQLTIGGTAAGANHLPTAPGQVSINIRDVLSDWKQRPNRLAIRRLDDGRGAMPIDRAALRQRILADLPGYVRFWSSFKDGWFGGLKPNTIVGPVPRDGGWGFIAAARYHLATGEAIVVKTTRGAARYTGIQITDPWMVAPDARLHPTSVNISQAKPDPDGGYTYVIAPEDPGVANWVDTGGLHDGYILLRWQALPVGATADGLLKSFKVVTLGDGALADLAPISIEQRRTEIAERRALYAERLKP